jgi:uncharacterized membrane protein (UPF0127 family)
MIMNLSRFNIFLFCLLLISTAHAEPTLRLQINENLINVEVASTPETRSTGLMERKYLPENQGMLFVFSKNDYHSMWMKDTYIPLSVAFIDVQGKIINIVEMTPLSEDTHTAGGLAKYALEMNGGWFRAKNIWPGQKIEGLGKAPAAREQ